MESKTTDFSKVLKLITVLQKCSGKAAVGEEALISPKAAKFLANIGLLLLTGLLGYGAYYIQPMISPFISLESLAKSLMMILLFLSFILSVKDLVTVLYTANDLPLLLPMPFSANQIVMAKLAVAARFPVILSFVIMNSVCLGFGIRAGVEAPFIIGTVIASVLIPVTGIALATLLVVVIFRVFGFIRNRDVTVVLGGLFTLVVTGLYIYINQKLQQGGSAQAVEAFSALASAASAIPNISFMSKFMFGGNVLDLLISVGISAAVILLSFAAVRLFYLSAALAMQNGSTNKKAVTKAALQNAGKADAQKALTAYEAKNTRRNPSYLIYGFAMTFLWPALMVLPLLLRSNSSMIGSVQLPLDMKTALISAMLVGITGASFACAFNILPATAFSREGNTLSIMKTLPIDFEDYFKSKRNFSMRICALGSVLYVILIGVACVIFGVIRIESCWVVLAGALAAYLLDLIFVNSMLLKNAKKPYVTWDTETEISRKLCWINYLCMALGIIGLLAFFVFIVISGMIIGAENASNKEALMIFGGSAALIIVLFIAAFAVNRYAVKKGAEKLLEFE
ncbi:MAG: hypothetical protein IJL78_02520 [Lachnospiraceae bacterium]|nr:hypothetical protein [Lachnospiraceae bacterium]